MEYLLLPAPLSSLPEEYHFTQTFKLRSLSEPPTPTEASSPRFGKFSIQSEVLKEEINEKSGQEIKAVFTRKLSNDSIKVSD